MKKFRNLHRASFEAPHASTPGVVTCSCSAARISHEELVLYIHVTRMRTRPPPWGPGAPPVIGIPLALNVFKMEDDALAPTYPVGRAIGAEEQVMEIVD